MVSESMAQSLHNSNYTEFWNTVKKHTRLKSIVPSSIDDVNGEANIANVFAEKYSELYRSAPYDVAHMMRINTKIDGLISTKCKTGACANDHVINTNDVATGIKLLKHNKSDGNEGLMSNHFIFGSTLLFEKIARLCTAMLCHGYAAPNLRLSTIIPIVKNKKSSINDSDNYRGIALSSILSKLIDIIIIKKQSNHLDTSDLQFGFKEKSSTVQCSFVAKEVINYYCRNEGNVYATFLDASKAFDRVKFDTLFELLLAKHICPTIARLLSFLYTNQQCRVKWCGEVSSSFSVQNGVKQGGVLSPRLFNIYLDELLCRLKRSGMGCYYGNVYVGSLAYADDVVLLSPTLGSLKEMLNICEQYSTDFNILFNASKTKLMVFGRNISKVDVVFQGTVASKVNNEAHVGNIISTDIYNDEMSISKACNEMYAKLNLLCLQFGMCSPDVLYKLFNSYCMSLYGSQLWNYENKSGMDSLYIAWRKCVRRIFNIPYNTHCKLVPLICKDSAIHTKLYKRFLRFFINAKKSENSILSTMTKHVLSGSSSKACKTLNFICYTYNIQNKYTISESCIPKLKDDEDEGDVRTAEAILDFIELRSQAVDDANINHVIEYLCTS